jgi:hypothetical protein
MMESGRAPTCGRPTKAGRPCKVQVHGSEVACGIHTTDQERAVSNAHRSGYQEGYEAGRKASVAASEIRISSLERQVEELRQRLDKETRIHEVGGDQIVDVGGYAYRWRGETPLEIGDRVLLPENYVSRLKHGPGPLEGTVTGFGTTYQGPLAFVLRRLDGR